MMNRRMKMLVRGLTVVALISLPVFGCGKSEGQGSADAEAVDNSESEVKTVASPEEIDVNAILEDSNEDDVDSADDVTGAEASGIETSGAEKTESEVYGDPSVDVDLTALSATMVYSEVFQMMYYPEDYIGKTVKMEGLFDHYHDDATGKDYYACIIQDATACCAQGIEFQLSDGNYPADATNDVMVKGTFETYEENGAKYCTLVDAELVN